MDCINSLSIKMIKLISFRTEYVTCGTMCSMILYDTRGISKMLGHAKHRHIKQIDCVEKCYVVTVLRFTK